MNNENYLKHEDKIKTRMGKSFLSERVVYRGYDLHYDLQNLSWIELYAFGITGRRFKENEVKMLNFIWVSTSYPDKSIWPNHITALAASARSTPSLGLSIGMAACEASIYGGKPFKTGIDFFLRAGKQVESESDLINFADSEIKKFGVIYGYGRPLASTDERIPHIIEFARKQKLHDGKHLNLAIQLEKILQNKKGLNMNVAAIYTALGADLGFTSEQFHLFMTPCFFAGMPPCFIEASENPEGSFLPIRCDRIDYSGPKIRKW